jgi:subtilase family serine protease
VISSWNDRHTRWSAILSLAGVLALQPAYSQTLLNNGSALASSSAIDEGQLSSDAAVTLRIELKLPDQAAFDKAVDDLYNPASPNYQKWMTDEDLKKFAPTADQVAKVTAELQKQGLTVEAGDAVGFSLKARGSLEAAQRAFQTTVHQFSAQGKSFTAKVGAARLTGGADQFVAGVTGLGVRPMQPRLKRPIDPRTDQPVAAIPLSKVRASSGGLSDFITNDCFTDANAYTYGTPGKKLPKGVYYGNSYNTDYPDKLCGFTAAQVTDHYSLTPAYQKGLKGEGQTIVIVDAYGYPDVLNDANIFSSLNGLPLLDSSNFKIIYPSGPPSDPQAGVKTQWDSEIALDVQWAHAMAPKAKIVMVFAVNNTDLAFGAAEQYILDHHLGNVVSNSWGGEPDSVEDTLEALAWNNIFKIAAAEGISVHFSTGDDGDSGLNTPIGAAAVPADSPYVTGVGGTSIIKYKGRGSVETGWGNYRTRLASDGLLDPPVEREAIGSGGGESVVFAKPSWQSGLPGVGRQLPDISALADPYTGVPIILTENGVTSLGLIGGTSLACPLFSGIWALAEQNAGHSLGQAAPHIARMGEPAIRDIVSVIGSGLRIDKDVRGVISEQDGNKTFSTLQIFPSAKFFSTGNFFSAIWPETDQVAQAISFGVDTSLTVSPGWDNVTGFGVPRGLIFIEAANN